MTLQPLRRNRLLAGLFAATLAITGIVGAGPAAADRPHHRIDYVALGDSYAAGQGGGAYTDDDCLRTDAAYPLAVDELRGVRLKADATCAGATSRDVVKEQIPWAKQQLKKAELVTITAGLYDLLTERIIEACDPDAVNESRHARHHCWKLLSRAIDGVEHWTYKALKKIDRLSWHVKILVTGYPRFYSDPDNRFERLVNKALDKLNWALRSAVERAQYHGVHVKFVKVTGLFAGHLLDDPFPWLHDDGPDQWHPNADGHGAYSHLVTEKVRRLF